MDDGDVPALTAAIARGNPEAFAAFYRAWFDRAYAKARRLARRDEGFCLDVVQDVMLKAARAMKPMRDGEALAAWMSRAVHTTALDHLRAELRRRKRETGAMVGPEPRTDPAELAELEDRLDWLRGEIAALDGGDRALLEARYGGASLRETGEGAGLGVNAAHGRLRRLVERLKEKAKERFDAAL